MFRLKVPKDKRSVIRNKLRVIDSAQYDFVLTTDVDFIEPDKINIVFNEEDAEKVSKVLDTIVRGSDVFVTVHNEIGQKNIESRNIQYFISEGNEIQTVAGKYRFNTKMKLYEIEELLKAKHFIRVSKHALVNINKIDYVKPALNSKLVLQMKNGDEVEVNRHYYKIFKKTLRI